MAGFEGGVFGIGRKQDVAMSQGEYYVYYERLKEDGERWEEHRYVTLYENAKKSLNKRLEFGADPKEISEYFAKMRDVEARKERAVLRDHFGIDIRGSSKNYNDLHMGEKLIKMYNRALSTKKIFERCLTLIQQTEGKKRVTNFFASYFNTALNGGQKTTGKLHGFEAALKKGLAAYPSIDKALKNPATFKDTAENIITMVLRNITTAAIQHMINDAASEIQQTQPLQSAYKDILNATTLDSGQWNELYTEFERVYGIPQLRKNILDELTKLSASTVVDSSKIVEEIFHSHAIDIDVRLPEGNNGNPNDYMKAGQFNESFATAMLQARLVGKNVQDGIDIFPSENVQVTHTGDYNFMKADIIISGGQLMNDILEENIPYLKQSTGGRGSVRAANVERISAITEGLRNATSSDFLIYVSQEEYTLNKNFTGRGGYEAGEQKLGNMVEMLKAIHANGKALIFSALQTLRGAVGENDLDKVETMFCRAIGTALFDDIETIGRPSGEGTAIHLLLLNGIYVPLSYYFNLLAVAFNEGDWRGVIKVRLSKGEIVFKTEETAAYFRANEISPWRYQREYALDNMTVDFKFLSRFKRYMMDAEQYLQV